MRNRYRFVFSPLKKFTGSRWRHISKTTLGENLHSCEGFVISAAVAVEILWGAGVCGTTLSQTDSKYCGFSTGKIDKVSEPTTV